MATKFEPFDDSKSDTTAPPSYDSSALSLGGSVQCRRPSVFSFLRINQKNTVLSRIRDLVTTANFTTSSVTPIVDSCAAALPAAEFSNLLQTPNIEGHTALYWAIVNNRREALSAFARFISQLSPTCSADLRLACMGTSDHALFTQLNLGSNISAEDESLRRFLGCPPDEIQVHECDENKFIVLFRFSMWQKRVHATKNVGSEFVAAGVLSMSLGLFLTLTPVGRIWQLCFGVSPTSGRWYVSLCLAQHSVPALPYGFYEIEAQKGKPGCATSQALKVPIGDFTPLAPKE
ncbi:hypothetical protein DFH29DRAFT_996181 [Suillus ampliporus]|nr:hypothetical protein DFH29DRAFT_996181 [Suillus ampliporus]